MSWCKPPQWPAPRSEGRNLDQGHPLAALVSAEDLELLEQVEDRLDLLDALQPLKEAEASGEEFVPLEALLEEFGLRA